MKCFLECVPVRLRRKSRREHTRSYPRAQHCRSSNDSNSVSSSASASSSSSIAPWQPKLSSISEDNVASTSTVVQKAEKVATSSKKVARKTAPRAKIPVCTSYGDGFGRASVPLVVPSFSAAALFIF